MNYYSMVKNFSEYLKFNRGMLSNWVKTNGTSCTYLKISPETAQDKHLVAYGRSASAFNKDRYSPYEIYLCISPENYAKMDTAFDSDITVSAPFDSRFKYEIGDNLIIEFNGYVFRYEISLIPEMFNEILYSLNLKYINKSELDVSKEITFS